MLPNAAWIEREYVNGFYPLWQRVAAAIFGPFPFAVGDVAIIVIVLLTAALVGREIRSHPWWMAVVTFLAIAGLLVLGFDVSYGWNIDRAPLETRVVYAPNDVTQMTVTALENLTIRNLNALAPRAHRSATIPLPLATLRSDWIPVVHRLGDDWDPVVGQQKPTLLEPLLALSGASGYMTPWTLEVQLASNTLWFERPFDYAHEWAHVAGFAREDEANYVALLTCIRSKNPVIAYSGWFELFLYLPRRRHYANRTFAPQVWQDFDAVYKRDATNINIPFSKFAWRTYNTASKVIYGGSGANYNELTRLFLAIPRDSQGLPTPLSGS